MSIEISPEIERGLVYLAEQRGLTVHDYLQEILAREAKSGSTVASSGDEKAAAFLAWADSFPETTPLSDEAIRRASLYPDRW